MTPSLGSTSQRLVAAAISIRSRHIQRAQVSAMLFIDFAKFSNAPEHYFEKKVLQDSIEVSARIS